MKSLKSKVILSAVVLIFALVATIGSTFAWFTVSSTVTASSLSLQVTTADSLLIRVAHANTPLSQAPASYASDLLPLEIRADHNPLDPTQYTTALSNASFSSDLGYSLSTWRLAPASAVQSNYASVIPGSLHVLFDASVSRPLTGAAVANSASGHVITLKFWVMSQSSKDLKVIATDGITGTSGEASVQTAIKNSTRLAFTSTGNATNGLLFGTDIDYAYDYATHQSVASLIATAPFSDTNFNKILDRPSTTPSLPTAYATYVGVDGTTVLQALTLNVPVVVAVTIFIEGWDEDARNYLSNAKMNVSFSFTIE